MQILRAYDAACDLPVLSKRPAGIYVIRSWNWRKQMASIIGTSGADTLRGGSDSDRVRGRRGDDDLFGGPGDDTVRGGRGDDTVHGGLGTDDLWGGRGCDIFSFGTVFGSRSGLAYSVDTGVGEGARDVILDFKQGADIIDLSLINFIGEQASLFEVVIPESDLEFEFIGSAAFTPGDGSGKPQVRFEIQCGVTVIQMDGIRAIFGGDPENPGFPPDGQVDAEIELQGEICLTKDDLIL
jgi:Ca2+-binding RTX toxin-like protein